MASHRPPQLKLNVQENTSKKGLTSSSLTVYIVSSTA
uniref:Uncharacterized protein n=1 Tax=Rhizophora mucronata TaxID=61149 RepID=A0A2P2IYJ9_RHIMU